MLSKDQVNETRVFSPTLNNQMSLSSLHRNENSWQLSNAAIIDIDPRSNLTLTKSLEKSHSSPLPMNRNQSAMSNNNPIESAHLIDQYSEENNTPMCLYSCVSEVGRESIGGKQQFGGGKCPTYAVAI